MERKARTNSVDALLEKVVGAVNNKYKKDIMSTLDSSSEFAEVKTFVSFGHYGLNSITGGGAPTGRLLEIYGAFSSGKSLLLSHLLAECQKAGGIAILDDCEHAYDKHFGEMVGIDNSRLLYTASESVEEVFDKMESTLAAIIKEDPDRLVVYAWDSVAAVSCLHELNTDNVDTGGYNTEKAKAITRGTRKMVGLIGKHNISLVVANQMKKAVGVIYGPQETTPGGDAIPFWASIRLKLGKGELIRKDDKENGEVIGIKCKAQATKNKIVKPFQRCEISIMFDQGMIYTSGCVDKLIENGLITPIMTESKGQVDKAKNSGFYTLEGSDKKWRKKELEEYFESNPQTLIDLLEE